MTTTITLTANVSSSVDLRNLNASTLAGKSKSEISSIEINTGSRTLKLGELFEIVLEKDSDSNVRSKTPPFYQLNLHGDLRKAINIGYRMKQGRISVHSDVGNGAGREMSGGELLIQGNASNGAGVAMRGGTLTVFGNTGDRTGAGLPGERTGMRGGQIFVHGTTGCATGANMRRGVIAVGGSSGELTGWNMRAGTILVAGNCGASPGNNMIRGTIIAGSANSPGPAFRAGESYAPAVMRLLKSWLNRNSFDACDELLTADCFQSWFGDQLSGGKGELFSVTAS